MTEPTDDPDARPARTAGDERDAAADRAWVEALPKAELHLHLTGSVRPATAVRLARERGLYPELSDDALSARLRAPARGADQAELLRAYEVPVALLQDGDALSVTAGELVGDLVCDGTRYAEIRFAPASHTRGGLALDAVMAVVGRAVADAVRSSRREGHLIDVRLIAIALRTDPPEGSLAVAEAAARAIGSGGVVGFDLAGLEAMAPDITPHLPAFRAARAAGLGISVHAGEWGGAPQVRAALAAGPDRIAHGGPAVDDPALMRELRARGITLDLCPTSNLQAALVERIEDHPLPRLLRAGVPVTLSTDGRTVSGTTLVEEAMIALGPLGLTRHELAGLQRHALRAAFLHHEEPLRARLLRDLEAWLGRDEETIDR